MQKIYGAKERQDGLYSIGRNKWELIYGFGKDTEEAESGYNWRKLFKGAKPTPEECAKLIKATINDATEEKILKGFVWREHKVWLSAENQFDYKAAHDLAVHSNGATLPVRFKFGTDDVSEYFTFENVEDLEDFYTSAVRFVNGVLNEGWDEKDWVEANKELFA